MLCLGCVGLQKKACPNTKISQSCPKNQQKKMQTSEFLMRNINQDTPKYLGSGRVSQNSQSQTQTRVFSKDEEKNLHFWR